MTDIEQIAAIEALLFLHGEPLSTEKLSSLLQLDPKKTQELCATYASKLTDGERGLSLLEKNGAYQLVTKPKYSGFLEQFVKDSLKEELTPAAVETLSLVAYFGPLTRAHIDFVRGVNSSFILRSLLMRGLIERKAAKGNRFEYEVTFDFLKQLGITEIAQLPKFAEYQELRQRLFVQEDAGTAPVITQTP